MFCDEALDAIEAIAADELMPDGRVAAHLASCPNCAAALVSARALEQMLQRRVVPATPSQFTSRTMARVRRARWRNDQFLDVGFNVAIGLVVFAVVGGVWMLLNRSGLAVGQQRRRRSLRHRSGHLRPPRHAVAAALRRRDGGARHRARHLVVGGAGCGALTMRIADWGLRIHCGLLNAE